ncbi:hypothetical protein BS78_09G073100 [Paspalum vaginatum]|nr:hypothetical protein BS78_09G073100 [Paspalum vaginatum]
MPTMRTLLLAAAVVAVYLLATPTMAFHGSPIDVNKPYIQELARWAVAEHVKQANDGIKFNKVVGAQMQEGIGITYHLIIDTFDRAGKEAKYLAVVHERDWRDQTTLLSFTQVN